MSFRLDLSIVPKPIYIWELRIGERFCLTETGYNQISGNYEIYLKVGRTKAVLETLEVKPIFLIPKLSPTDIGYKLIEEFKLTNG